MSDFADWLFSLVKAVFVAIWDFVIDAFIAVLDLVLSALLALITALPAPAFMTSGLNNAMNGITSDVWFFAGNFHLPECMAILGAAVTFRLARKAVTLFQW